MKRKALLVSILLLLGMVVSSAILGGCDYVTGEAIETTPAVTAVAAVKIVTPEEAYQLFTLSSKWVHAIDVRTPREYAEGHLLGSVNIDYNTADFKEQVNKLYKDESYLLYCRSGSRSATAAQVMIELGFKDVFNMIGGIRAWEAAGLPIEH